MRRVYYALTFKQDEINKVIENVEELKKHASSIKPIPYNSIHMTLAFIGEVEEEKIPQLLSIRDELEVESFDFELDQLSYFEDRKNSKLYYLSGESDALMSLQSRLVLLLYKNKIDFHDKQFLPHMTLSRKTELVGEVEMKLPIRLHVEKVRLLESIPYKNTRIGIEIE